jgi:hypothetical protein
MKRKPATKESHVAMSMAQAESLWGISKSTLRIAKAAGCPAFVQSKIYRDDLVEWLEKNPTAVGKGEALTDAAELKRQKTEAEVRLLRAKISREERETIPLAEAKAEWGRAASDRPGGGEAADGEGPLPGIRGAVQISHRGDP